MIKNTRIVEISLIIITQILAFTVGYQISDEIHRERALKQGIGEYNSQTGEFQYLDQSNKKD